MIFTHSNHYLEFAQKVLFITMSNVERASFYGSEEEEKMACQARLFGRLPVICMYTECDLMQ